MKRKISLLLMICIIGSTFAVAQRKNNRTPRRDRIARTLSPEDRAKHMTDRMTFDYVLTEKQAAEVLKLNQDWVKKAGEQAEKFNLPRAKNDTTATVRRFSSLTDAERDEFQNARVKLINDYDAQLKKILTKEQFAKHEKRFDVRYKGRNEYRHPRRNMQARNQRDCPLRK
ncbi:MAG: DUF4890 domain-containing protein [Bacteroides sp.]|nr:DUF4890 domain-containing protein [Bacteroides sp.]MDD4720373.1 DUF4890 domain-containing protein [Bacteroides sp.]